MYSVYGICNPLLDMVAHAGFEVLEAMGAAPGTMNLIDERQRDALLARVRVTRVTPGGSVANTLRGLAWLCQGSGEPPLYAGAVGDDELGRRFERELRAVGVETQLARKPTPTGTSTIIVTPDHERTMFTCLGASRLYGREDCPEPLPRVRWLYFTAYMWDTPNQEHVARQRASEARETGVPVAFDVADPAAVTRYRAQFLEWIPEHVSLLLGNRAELGLLTGQQWADPRELAAEAGRLAPLVVVKSGAEGCVVNDRGRLSAIPGMRVPVVDTIGAGDFFAAGFLYALLVGREPCDAGRLANAMGAAIVGVEGCCLEGIEPREVLGALAESR